MTFTTRAAFVHPSIYLTQADLDRIKTDALSNLDPWKTSFSFFMTYAAGSNTVASAVTNETIGVGQFQIRRDAASAYDLALKWYITGDANYKNAAIRIINAWSYTMQTFDTNDNLSAQAAAEGFGSAGEILQYEGSGWSAADIAQYKSMMLNLLYPSVAKAKTDTMTGNQGIGAIEAAMVIGVACDVQQYFDDGIASWTNHPCCAIENFILPSGQMGEAGRDQAHASGEIMSADDWALVAWNQGVDLYSAYGNRLLAGFEYWCQYNLGYDVPFTVMGNCNYTYGSISSIDRGRLAYVHLEEVYHHYVTLGGLSSPHLNQAVTRVRPDAWGFGTLRYYSGPAITSTQIVANGTYPITSKLNNMSASVPGDSTVNDVQLDIENYTARPSQRWTFTHQGMNVYKLLNLQNKTTDIPGGSVTPGIKVQVYSFNGGVQQFWRAVQNPDGTLSLLNFNTSYGMTINGGSLTNAAGLTQDIIMANNTPYYQEWTLVTSTNSVPAAPTGLTAGGLGTNQMILAWTAPPITTSFNVKRSTTSGRGYVIIATNLTTITYFDTNLAAGTYYYVVSAVNQNGEGANSAEVFGKVGLPEPWVDVDVATVTTVGSASFSSARAFTVNGSGGDIGSVGDSFNFVYLNLTNSGTIIARLASTAFVGTIGKIGLTMRETTNGNSIQAFTFLDRQNNTLRMTFRSSTGGNTSSVGSGPASIIPPEWLKLQRAGNTFTSSYSSDGSTWTPFATNTFGSFASPYCLGLAVCSRNAALATGVFDNVSVPGFASPTTPTNLTATAASSSEIDLNWSASSTANGYNIYRSTTNGGTYSAIATGVSSTSFNNTDLSSGTNYYYVVTAVNTAGESTNSLQVGATTIPAAPASLSATGGSAQVELVWLASFGATSYNVYRSDTSGGPYAQIADSLATTNYTDTGVVGGTTNYYVVTAENSSGEGVNSTEASAMTIPSAPTGLTAIAGDGQVALNWIASMGASGYNVKRSTTDRGVYSTIANVTSVAYTNTGLSNCTLYYFVVSATNAIGESLNSSQVSVRSVSMTSLPINLTVNNARIQFFWPTDHTGWRLQAQTNSLNNGLGTNWVMLVGSNSTNQMTVPINRGGGSVFYRLVYP